MSDAVTNTEVEDVLSSIRRLVSEDKRPTPEAKPEPTADRLVLTPALRVADPVEAKESDLQDNDPQNNDPENSEGAAAQDVVDAPMSLEAWSDVPADDIQEAHSDHAGDDADHAEESTPAEVAEDTPDNAWVEDFAAEVEAAEQEDQHAEHLDEAPSEDHEMLEPEADPVEVAAVEEPEQPAEVDAETDDRQEEVDHHAALIDALVASEEDLSEPEPEMEAEIEPPAERGADPEPQSFAEAFEAADAAARAEEEQQTQKSTPEDDGGQRETQESLSAKIAALESVIARRQDQWEPDDAGVDDYAGTEPPAMEWEDATPQDAAATANSDPTPAADFEAEDLDDDLLDQDTRSGPEIYAADEDVLDEETLRDMVADIVREELQGALGERITRNVRKLVRREIHRALAAQELD